MTSSSSRGKRTRTPSPVPPASGPALGVVVSDCTPEPPHKRLRSQSRVPVTDGSDAGSSKFALKLNVYATCFSVIKAKALFKKTMKKTTMKQPSPGTMSPPTGALLWSAPATERSYQPMAGRSAIRKPGHAEIFLGPGPSQCMEQWQRCNASPWVLRTLAKGYRLQFARRPPPFTQVVYTEARGQAAAVLQQEIMTLLEKKAVREVPLAQSRSGFYSRYFLVKKKGGGLRPILDLRALNGYLRTFKFKMLTAKSLTRSVRPGDWFTSIDLKDAYFHIGIYPPHRKFLRFGFQGKLYEYTVLPFGMSLSPRVFVRCTETALAPLRQQGLRIASYIDDWLLCADSAHEAAQHTSRVLSHVTSLGFNVNFAKSMLTPTQSTDFIGISLDSVAYTAKLSADRVGDILKCAALFKAGCTLQLGTCLRMAGLMASAISLARLGRLYMRPFQRWLRSLHLSPRLTRRRVKVSPACVLALRWWSTRHNLTEGVPLGLPLSRKVVTTDASLSGWGATHEGRTARGVWDDSLRGAAHINFLELLAVSLALREFEPFLRGHHVLVRTDNTTTMAYINRQGGVRSLRLGSLAHRLLVWCDSRFLSLTACHVPGLQNSAADLLSRGPLRYSEWSLHPWVADQIWSMFGVPVADLFATEENTKSPLFFSLTGRPTLGLDAFAHQWPRGLLYAFPPLELIPQVLARVRVLGVRLLLVAPAWGSWRQDVAPLLYRDPWQLPLRVDLLTQARGEIFHPCPGDLDLWVWPLEGRLSP